MKDAVNISISLPYIYTSSGLKFVSEDDICKVFTRKK